MDLDSLMINSSHFGIKPVSGALGAEIDGVDLGKPISAVIFDDLHQALMDYKVIFFRHQDLTPEQHIAFSRRFGEPMEDMFVKESEDYPELMELLKEADDTGYNFGGSWHSDSTYRTSPPMGVSLYARELPPFGGDTIWCNMEMVFENLSVGMQLMLEPLYAEHLAQGYREKLAVIKGDYSKSFENIGDVVRVEVNHPVVRVHPVTGRKSLFINDAYTHRFANMTAEESQPLIEYLCNFAIRPYFTCRFSWQPGSLAIWDNRNTMHYAISDYHGHRRLMHRYTMKGDKPMGMAPYPECNMSGDNISGNNNGNL